MDELQALKLDRSCCWEGRKDGGSRTYELENDGWKERNNLNQILLTH